MVVRGSTVLISYSDSTAASQQRDLPIAQRLTSDLQRNGITVQLKRYSDSSQDIDTYQWLIFIYSPEIKSSPMATVINNTLDQVVKRRKRGVIAVTASSAELPNEWATIRKYDYDPTNPREANAAVDGILRSMRYAKIPYAEAEVLARGRQVQRPGIFAPVHGKKNPLILAVAALMLGVIIFLLIRSLTPPINPPIGNTGATATAQARAHATQTALANTPQVSPTVDTKEYQHITGKTPTIPGFRDNEKWQQSQDQVSCAFDASNPAAYHARISTQGKYIPCSAKNTSFTNFALQVTMSIAGDAGGVIFRSQHGTYYRVAFNQSDQSTHDMDILSLYLCVQDCSTLKVNQGTQLWSNPVPVTPGDPVTLTIIAQGNTIDLYYNGTPATRVIDTTHAHVFSGEIGVYAASLGNDTDVTFSDLKVWSLDKQQ